MSYEKCPNQNCKLYPACHKDKHHIYYPRANYTTRLEREFRASHVVNICRALHDEIHTVEAPPKPNRQQMLSDLRENKMNFEEELDPLTSPEKLLQEWTEYLQASLNAVEIATSEIAYWSKVVKEQNGTL